MSADSNEIIRKVNQWVKYADEDLRLAKHGLTLSSSAPYRLIAYHAQQCAEKIIKAYLIYHKIDFPYTHSISRLIEILADKMTVPEELNKAEELTVFAVTTRYPGEDEEVTKDEALEAISVAETSRDIILEMFHKDGFTFSEL